jgi:hypothetical protein
MLVVTGATTIACDEVFQGSLTSRCHDEFPMMTTTCHGFFSL